MFKFLRILLSLIAFAVAGQAFALIPTQPSVLYGAARFGGANPPQADYRGVLADACAVSMAYELARPGSNFLSGTVTRCTVGSATAAGSVVDYTRKAAAGGGVYTDYETVFQQTGASVCPANSTQSGSQCACNTGFDESGGNSCVPHVNQCTGKAAGVVNWTAGWQRTPAISNSEPLIAPNAIPTGATTMCVGGCSTEINVTDPCPGCTAGVSQSPNAQGLYRVSIQFMGKPSGSECTASSADKPVTPNEAQDPPCPGYVGQINGVNGCYGTASNPVSGTPPPPQVVIAPKVPGNPPAGPSSAGAATPSTGTGGSAGGPASAAVGPGGSGGTGTVSGASNGSGRVATQSGTEQAACGAPGQPVCAVKVDESGTPTSVGTSFDAAKTSLDTSAKSTGDAIASIRDSTANGSAWTFSFQLPTGCTAYQVGQFKGVTFTMNPCAYQSTIHDLMSMIWAAVTAFCIIGMVGRTIRET